MDKNELKVLTHLYWEEYSRDTERYIKELLPEELKYSKQLNRIGTSNTEILVQLVGFSWDPLLISVCAYKPQKIYIILNEWYGEQEGKARGDKFKEYIRKLNEESLIDTSPEILPTPLETVKDTPVDVFKFLKKHILPHLNNGKQIIIDITGAKKSMVSGAYLFASFSNCTVSYVDHGKYSEEYGRPYGYTCKINELKNPMELFKLREWSRVEQLYNQYAFKSAFETINEIKGSTKSFIEKDELEAINLLTKCLEFYENWDEGNYKESLDIYGNLKTKIPSITCPTAVEKLGNIWPDKNNLKSEIKSLESPDDINNSFYLEEELLIYVYDELEKIKRLIRYKEDYRSALLRAAGLSDFLLKARIIRLWMKDQFIIEMNNECLTRKSLENKEDQSKVDKKLLEFAGASYIIKSLRWKPSKEKHNYMLNLYGLDKEAKGHRSENGTELEKFWGNISYRKLNLPDDIFMLRNKAIHFCLSVPKETSEVAVEFAEKNMVDFKEKWTKRTAVNGKYEAMSWYDLCDTCGIKFLPKLRRNTNE